jgi:predicted dehydrogenase
MVRIGVVGLGMMGTMHIGAYRKIPGAQLVAICYKDPKRAAGDFSDAWSNMGDTGVKKLDMSTIKGTMELADLLRMPEVDIVDICLPTPFHADAAVAALAAGKHVLCEKPLARTSAEAQRIAEAARQAKGFFMPAMCMRFWPQWAWLKAAVADRRYGQVLGASFYRIASMPPGWFSNGQWSGGALLDLHIHDTDFVHYLFGVPRAVFSRGYSKTSGCIDHLVTQYIYEGPEAPKLVSAAGGWCMADGFGFKMKCLVNFERATVTHDISADKPFTVAHDGKLEEVKLEGDGYSAELAYFVDCVKAGRRPTTVTAEDAITSIRITEAEQKSIETGRIVEV